MQKNINERVKDLILLKSRGNASNFARSIGVSSQRISNILHNKNSVSRDIIERILKSFPDISFTWLTMGEGEMHVTPVLNDPENFYSRVENKEIERLNLLLEQKDKEIMDLKEKIILIQQQMIELLNKHNS